jgi:outer membrane cobalamin receptor
MRLIIFLLMFLFFASAKAQQDSATTSLDEVVVTAQRVEQKTLWIPYSVKKISNIFFKERSVRTTPEALQGMNGVFIQKTAHGGGSAFIRGLTGNQTLILTDGIRLNNSTFRYGPNQYLNTIDPYIIDRIEVAKGTGSVQYGTDALGGVIHVLSNDPFFSVDKSSWRGKVLAKFMSGDMEKTGRAELGYASDKIAFTGGFTYRNFGDLIGGDTTGKQSPSGYNERAFNAKAKFLLHDNVQFTLSHQNVAQQHVPVYHKIILENFGLNKIWNI